MARFSFPLFFLKRKKESSMMLRQRIIVPCKVCHNYPMDRAKWTFSHLAKDIGKFIYFSLECDTCKDGVSVLFDKDKYLKSCLKRGCPDVYSILTDAWIDKNDMVE